MEVIENKLECGCNMGLMIIPGPGGRAVRDEIPKESQPDALKKEYKSLKGDYIAFVKEYNSIKIRRSQKNSESSDGGTGSSSSVDCVDYELTPEEYEALKQLQGIWKKLTANGGLDIMKVDTENLFYDMEEYHKILDVHLNDKSSTWVKYYEANKKFKSHLFYALHVKGVVSVYKEY